MPATEGIGTPGSRSRAACSEPRVGLVPSVSTALGSRFPTLPRIDSIRPRTITMKKLLLLVLLTSLIAVGAAAGPIRVLYIGKEGTDATRHCHVLMRDLGRDAIWFDYTSDPGIVTPEWIARFDALLVDAPTDDFKALAGTDAKRLVTADFSGDESSWAGPVREKLLAAAGAARRKEWEAFLAQREPEKREANSNVANYERRPEAVTFVLPLSVKGSKERTQIPVDMRLELFASEPDIAKPIAFAWDERGRLWVAETRDYPHGPAGHTLVGFNLP